MKHQITIADGGPYLVSGGVPITWKAPIMSEHGDPLTWKTTTADAAEVKERVALCRCGASDNKPYCDGSHARVEWDGTDNAPDDAYDELRRCGLRSIRRSPDLCARRLLRQPGHQRLEDGCQGR